MARHGWPLTVSTDRSSAVFRGRCSARIDDREAPRMMKTYDALWHLNRGHWAVTAYWVARGDGLVRCMARDKAVSRDRARRAASRGRRRKRLPSRVDVRLSRAFTALEVFPNLRDRSKGAAHADALTEAARSRELANGSARALNERSRPTGGVRRRRIIGIRNLKAPGVSASR